MQVLLNHFDDVVQEVKKNGRQEFMAEMRDGYVFAVVNEKEKLLNEYETEFQNCDKDSVKGQFLDSWIFVLKKEIKEIKKVGK